MDYRRYFAKIVSGFVPGRARRTKVRNIVRFPQSFEYIRWVRNWAKQNDGGVKKLKFALGVGCHNLVVLLNDRHVFKFPLRENAVEKTKREVRIVNALMSVSPIRIPKTELIPYKDIIIRRQEFVPGKLICDFEPRVVTANREKIAKQLANFMYKIGQCDAPEISDLKPDAKAKPAFMYGWFHNDIGQNFLMDDDFNIVGFVDWEGACFCDFAQGIATADWHWAKLGGRGLGVCLVTEYAKLYFRACLDENIDK